MTPISSNGPGRGPGRDASGRSGSGRGSAPRRKPGSPASSGKSTPRPAARTPKPAERRPQPKSQPKSQARSQAGARRPVTASRSTGLLAQNAPARTRPVVSQTSAQRFAAKVRARRRKQTLTAIAAVVVLTAGGWLTFFSSWATVNQVEVSGLDRVKESDVRAVAETQLGHSMLLAGTGEVTDQVRELRLVKDVRVTRSWPGVLKVAVTERRPVAALPAAVVAGNSTSGSSQQEMLMVQLVDDEGVVIETLPARGTPEGLPRIDVKLGQKHSVDNLRGTLAVLEGLPQNLASRVRAIGTSSPDGIWLRLSAPAEDAPRRTVLVQWGDAEKGEQKAEVLNALLKQKAKTYDVRAPGMPSTAS